MDEKHLLTPLPDGTAEVRSFAVDDGPVPPTGKDAAADWNDGYTMRQLGWA
ncbi:hypothetical protein [Mycolicibacterium sp. 120270]|uniref:hypothetical protein n=1 Tax=Mycolicibacterium sp. 120270 TaxID=3090600 RepID=UPI00299DC71C|nr:hypothetical protein [Mycolicibacterium sp. 120270]MDX1882655.1 hypothetical protein [Mycolicibacterium sp. 120270]